MFQKEMTDAIIESVDKNRISDYIQPSEEYNPLDEFYGYVKYIYNRIADSGIDIEHDENAQSVALTACNEAVKTRLLGLAGQTSELPSDKIDDLLFSDLGIAKPKQK